MPTRPSNILGQLQNVYGTPGGAGTLETSFSNFTTALQALSTSSGSQSAQTAALSAAQSLAQSAEYDNAGHPVAAHQRRTGHRHFGDPGQCRHEPRSRNINTQLQGLSPTDPAAATLMDQRDSAINELSQLMDVRVVTDGSNQTSVFTNSGIQLVGDGLASQMTFTSPGSLTANSLYNTDPSQNPASDRSRSSCRTAPAIDMVANNAISSGQIAADLKLRDQTLVQAQTQVDQLAATLSSSLSDQTTAGTAVTGPPAGFASILSNILPGNTINLTYTDSATNTQQQISIVNVTDPTALPLQNAAERQSANDRRQFLRRHGVGRAAQLNSALGGANLQFSNPSGIDVARRRERRRRGDRQRRFGDDDGLVAGKRQPAAAVVHRRQFALYRRDHRQPVRR